MVLHIEGRLTAMRYGETYCDTRYDSGHTTILYAMRDMRRHVTWRAPKADLEASRVDENYAQHVEMSSPSGR